MVDTAAVAPKGLTWKILKQVFPVAPSLRREHWDLLSRTGVEESQRNDDEIFFGALLHKFRRDGEFMVDLDRRFLGSKKKKDKEKALTCRAKRWLFQQFPDLQDYDDILAAPPGLFGEDTAERNLRDMIAEMRRVEKQAKARLGPLVEERWKSAGEELRNLLGELGRPTPEAVERIEAAVQALLEAGREVRKLAAELERRREDIRALLGPFAGRDRAAKILERLDSLEAGQLAELAEIVLDASEHIDALAEAETGLAAKEEEFEKLRSGGAPWAAIARQAEALAQLEAEKGRRHAAIETVLARMAAAVEAEEPAVEPSATAFPEVRRHRTAEAAGSATKTQDRRRPDDEAAKPADSPALHPPLPSSWEKFTDWCAEHLAEQLMLSSRARNSIKKAQYEDVGVAAKCLLWLADEYRHSRLEGSGNGLQGPVPAGSEVRNDRCGGDSFEFDWQGKRLRADWHIKSGGNTRDPARCLRIYYCWHENGDGGQVVVGDMPAHVRSRVT